MKNIGNTLKRWIAIWPDIWAAPAAILGLWASYYIFYWLDPTIGTMDMGVLQALLFAVVIIVALNAFAFLGMEFNDKHLWKYYKDKFDDLHTDPDKDLTDENDFKKLTPWQRIILLYSWRAFLLLVGVVIFVNLI